MAIIKYTNVIDRLPDQAGINKVLAERTWDEMGRQAEYSTEIGLNSQRGIISGCVSTEYMVYQISLNPKPTQDLVYIPANYYINNAGKSFLNIYILLFCNCDVLLSFRESRDSLESSCFVYESVVLW